MLKKIVLAVAVCVLLFGVLAPSVQAAQMEIEVEAPGSQEPVDYYLAYPGILPDHFLYPIKMIRDRILLFLTTDALKKAELYLLFADKRIGAAKSLIEGGKEKLGVTTATKAEKYLEKAINQEEIAQKSNKETTVFLEKLGKATRKHEEILEELQTKVKEQARETIEATLKHSRQNQEEVRGRRGH